MFCRTEKRRHETMAAGVRKKFPRSKEIYTIEEPIEPTAIIFKKNVMIPLLSEFTFERKASCLQFLSQERVKKEKIQSLRSLDISTQTQQRKRKGRHPETSPYLKNSLNWMRRWIQVLESTGRESRSCKGANVKRKKRNRLIFPNPINISVDKNLIDYDYGNLPFNKILQINDYVGIPVTNCQSRTDRRIRDLKIPCDVDVSLFPLPLVEIVNKDQEEKISNLQERWNGTRNWLVRLKERATRYSHSHSHSHLNLTEREIRAFDYENRTMSCCKLKEPTVIVAVDCNNHNERREIEDKIEELPYQGPTLGQTPRILTSKSNGSPVTDEPPEHRCVVKYSWQVIGTGTQALLQNHDDTEYWNGILINPKRPYRDSSYAYEHGKLTKGYYIATNRQNESCTQTIAEKESQADSADCISKYSWQNLISQKRSRPHD